MALELGSGTQADPFLLVNFADVKEMLTTRISLNEHFALIDDLDVTSSTITTSSGANFSLNGRGHKLSIKSSQFPGNITCSLIDVWLKVNVIQYGFTNSARANFKLSQSILEFNSESSSYTDIVAAGSSYGILIAPGIKDRVSSSATNIYKHGTPVANTINTANFPDGNPFNRDNYPNFTEDKWLFDGISLPRPRPQATADLTNRYAVKGQSKVGGNGRQRNLAVFTENGLRYKVQDTRADGSFFLNLNDVTTPVIVLAYDYIGAKAAINTAYSLNQIIHPATPNGFRYRCTLAGNSGTTIPSEPWPTSAVLTIGAAKFTPEPVYEPKAHGPLLPVLFNVITEQPV
ncbi:hypothetical protein IIDPJIOB_04254 [Aeromonas veronii]|uniref:hypothetical protein n=1 Tax=Aeromonas veronii TaxID=654 RepID=UPI00366B0094